MFKSLRVLSRQDAVKHQLQHDTRDFERDHHVVLTPAVGTRVVLITDSWYLRDEFGAAPGQLGTVVHHSKLNRDDHGVLVNWGATPTDRVRMNLDELRLA